MKAQKSPPVAVAYEQGSEWQRFRPEWDARPVHSILFEDGSIFDTYHGWRPQRWWKTREAVRKTLKAIDQRDKEHAEANYRRLDEHHERATDSARKYSS